MLSCLWQPTTIYGVSTKWQGLLDWKCRLTKTNSFCPQEHCILVSIHQVSHIGLMTQVFSHCPTRLDSYLRSMKSTEELFPQSPLEQWGASISLYYSLKLCMQNKTQRAEDVLTHFAAEGWIALPHQGFQHTRHCCHFPGTMSLAEPSLLRSDKYWRWQSCIRQAPGTYWSITHTFYEAKATETSLTQLNREKQLFQN